MCDQLSALRKATSRYAAGFRPELLSAPDASRAVADAAAIEATASTLKALAAARVAETGDWKKAGHRSPAEALARDTGTSVSTARDALDIGRRLASQPEVDSAARQGKLSSAQLAMITNAAEADPLAERRLLDEAQSSSLAALKDTCARTKAAAHPDLEQRRRCIHEARSLRSWTDVEGVWRLSASGNPEDGAQIMAALAPVTDSLFRSARTEGRREPPTAYAFDALVQLAREAMSTATPNGVASDSRTAGPARPTRNERHRPGAPVKLLLRVDYDAFLRGAPATGETCELVGYGPISMSAVNDLLETGDPFVGAILTKAKALVGVAHLGRQPTAHQQSALEWLYPSCAAKGCHAQGHLERDHRVDWAKTHYTMFDLLDLLCAHHHDLKTREGWELVEGSGKRPFVPPNDERHPRQCKSGGAGENRGSNEDRSGPVPRRKQRSNHATGPPNAAA
jgi:hypothetical protein